MGAGGVSLHCSHSRLDNILYPREPLSSTLCIKMLTLMANTYWVNNPLKDKWILMRAIVMVMLCKIKYEKL